jgi:hypothetical protein
MIRLVGLFRISRVSGEKVNLPEKRHQPQKGNDVIQRNPSCKVISANTIDGSSELNPDSIHVVVMSFFLEDECRPLSLLKQLHPILKSKGVIIFKVPNFACWNRIIRGGDGVVFATQTTSTISRRARSKADAPRKSPGLTPGGWWRKAASADCSTSTDPSPP